MSCWFRVVELLSCVFACTKRGIKDLFQNVVLLILITSTLGYLTCQSIFQINIKVRLVLFSRLHIE